MLDETHSELFGSGDTSEERREILLEEIEIASEKCPNLKSIKIWLHGEEPYIKV